MRWDVRGTMVFMEGMELVITIIAARDRVITIIVIAKMDVIATIFSAALFDAANRLDALADSL